MATIKLFLLHEDATRLRTAEISNWSGKALAAPRTDLAELLQRDEVKTPGVYLLFGTDPESGEPLAYIGEAEVVRDRIRQHKGKEFWISVVAFVSKDENLTKAHVRYLEGRLIEEAHKAGRYRLYNANNSTTRLPESDREAMEVFLLQIRLVLPVLGSDILTPIAGSRSPQRGVPLFYCRNRGATATGRRTETGFVVFKGSTAMLSERPSTAKHGFWVISERNALISNGTLVPKKGFYEFARDAEFKSPSSAAAVILGGGTAGPLAWKRKDGKTLKEVEES